MSWCEGCGNPVSEQPVLCGLCGRLARKPDFPRVRRKAGYSIEEVDAFVVSVARDLRQQSPLLAPCDVDAVKFRPVFWRESNAMENVDTWFEALSRAMRRR